MKRLARILPYERTRHALIAAVIALVLGLSTLLDPLDRFVWMWKSRIDLQPVSGEIVFIETRSDFAAASRPQDRMQLAETMTALKAAGADHVYLDFVFESPSMAAADAKLGQAVADLGEDVSLTTRMRNMPGRQPKLVRSRPQIRGKADELFSDNFVDFSGISWFMEPRRSWQGEVFDSLAVRMAGDAEQPEASFPIAYNFDVSSIPSVKLSAIDWERDSNSPDQIAQFAGKQVLIGPEWSSESAAAAPGQILLPRSFTSIYAAETLKRGQGPWVPAEALLALYLLAILSTIWWLKNRKVRKIAYIAIGLSPIVLIPVFSELRILPLLAPSLVFLALYSVQRHVARRKLQQKMHDEVIGLPTFAAMKAALAKSPNPGATAVVMAKIHRFDEVTTTLGAGAIGEYVQQIASRFRIADQELVVYSNGGKYLGWLAPAADPAMLESHLRGLRAIFAHPLLVRGSAVDVGITFACDNTGERDAARKMAGASSTLERTTEAHEPVLFAEVASEGDMWWSISLQAKIDEALANGHIFPVFQPQIDLATGKVMGAEALVRWNDPERGSVSPSYFVEQCEHAGRMDHLTQHVLERSLEAAKLFVRHNSEFTMSVNISATLLRDFRLTDMVERALAESGYDPRKLVLEITETSRIADYEVARSVMERLRLIGVRLSIDDFGVGAASLETLLRLPFDELKIDRAFTAQITRSAKAKAIAQMLITFGIDTGITIVAEGAENEEILAVLRDSGCHMVQGYGISHPLDEKKFSQFQQAELVTRPAAIDVG
ncbi:EAL domain-containing protein [Altererythrobacter sp. CAU 1778]